MNFTLRILMVVFLLCCLCVFGIEKELHAAELLIIANTSVPAEKLSPDEIKNIFSGKILKWGNNDMITLIVSDKSEVHKSFCIKYMKRNANQFENLWRQNMYSGIGKYPIKVDSIDELVEYVSKTRGAVGYIYSSKQLPDNVKVISE